MGQRIAFATGVPSGIYAFYRYTGNSIRLSHLLSPTVPMGLPRLGRGLSPRACGAACVRFTPSDSGQRSQPTYYRGCWHVVSRCLFLRYRQVSSLRKEVYDPKAFIPHAALPCQGFPHCTRSLTAASRRSLGRVSVPVWLVILSDQLRIGALVSHYLTN